MCGIAGIVAPGQSGEVLARRAGAMADALRHRGPDADAVWTGETVALSHRRLKVIDLETGGQPMVSPCGRYVIVFNGEIYNYREIGKRLQAAGHRLRTASDTEVLLLAFLEYGPACLDYLEGMFAFAVWDEQEKSLFAARDRMGKKPFCYMLRDGEFLFASELSAIRRGCGGGLALDREAMARFLTCKYVPAPATIYDGVRKLPPGHMLQYRDGSVTVERYWNLPRPTQDTDDRAAAERIRSLLRHAVERRLVSDVPLGAFLSGGLDSTVVVSLMAELADGPVRTFSIGFDDPSYDETVYAAQAAEFAGTDHAMARLSGDTCAGLVREVVGGFDEPMADPSIMPTYFLCRFAREHVTVALSGDGADELFGGYEHFPAFLWAHRLSGAGKPLGAALSTLANLLPVSTGYVSPRLVLKRFGDILACPGEHRIPRLLMALSPEAQAGLWQTPSTLDAEALFGDPLISWDEYAGCAPLDRAFNYFAREFLPNYILTKMDRCSMLHGLEVRSPFLDTGLVEYVYSLPASLKIPEGSRKKLMKQALGRYMPPSIRKRNKRGFLMPVAGWLKTSLREHLMRFTEPGFVRKQGLFREDALQRMLAMHDSGRADLREELWTYLVLQLWLETHGQGA